MIEGKLVAGLRAVAGQMTLDEPHENRASFTQEVRDAEVLKPAEKIDSIKMHQVTGPNGGSVSGDGYRGTPVKKALDSVLGMVL